MSAYFLTESLCRRSEFDQAPAPGSMVSVEVYNKQSIGSDKLIGQAKISIPVATPEECHDVWIDLELPPNMKEKNKELLDGKLGNIHLRLLYSNAKETPPAAPGNNQISDFFITKDIKRRMKSGDILLYSGIGPLDSVIKTLTNTRYSRAALVFRAPNKWTEKDQLYLFEVTRNVGGFPDAFNVRFSRYFTDRPLSHTKIFSKYRKSVQLEPIYLNLKSDYT
jgi:hypothetical protein